MAELQQLMDRLGTAGLLERLDSATLFKGKEHIGEIITSVKNKKYEHNIWVGDDFIPDTGLYNALGALYPLLPRPMQDEALAACLAQFDSTRSDRVQINHTSSIREPLLLADISIVRPYWPGLIDWGKSIEKYPLFQDFKEQLLTSDGLFDANKVYNDFCVAYTVLRSDTSSFGAEYALLCSPTFLWRVINGIAGMRFYKDPVKGRERLQELLPQEVQTLVDEVYEKRAWVDKSKFP